MAGRQCGEHGTVPTRKSVNKGCPSNISACRNVVTVTTLVEVRWRGSKTMRAGCAGHEGAKRSGPGSRVWHAATTVAPGGGVGRKTEDQQVGSGR